MLANIESPEYETVDDIVDATGPIGTGISIIRFIYEFGKTDPLVYALNEINREIELIKTQLAKLSERLDTVTQRQVKGENLARIRALQEQVTRLSTIGVQLQRSPDDRARAAEAAFEAGARADTLLTDQDLWLWSDVRITQQRDEFGNPVGEPAIEPVDPDFKTTLALPVYSMAVTIWLAAMMVDTASDKAAVQSGYGAQLDRHIGAVSESIAGKIRSRITCQPIPVEKYARNGVCTFTVQCTNAMARTRTVIRELQTEMPEGTSVLCTIDPGFVALDERDIQDKEPAIILLGLLEQMLRSVAAAGHLPAEQFVGQFPNWTAAFVGMYGVDRDQNLHYLTQMLPTENGAWTAPLLVGTSWNFEAIVHGGSSAVLAKQDSGNWLWYGHRGSEQTPPTDEWRGPNPIGAWVSSDPTKTKWFHFGAGYGVVYGIVVSDETGTFRVGDLYWNRYNGYQTGEGAFATVAQIGTGWDGLSPVFSGSEGIIYGVQPSGVLRWYNHTGWGNGANTWAEPRDLATNVDWKQFSRIVPGGEGVVYGVLPNGAMRCYRHLDWRTGGDRLEGPISVGNDWNRYPLLFASQPGAVTGVR
ncbi:tachylectin-related carbohydrate-binding protein [Micromonospora sp. H33]|uniref:tachylectin-related carbohydrate-binding protein n=1 Tax=Micromonospora sp. H33 TaxID=3452215 RepID=UPI003F88E098